MKIMNNSQVSLFVLQFNALINRPFAAKGHMTYHP